MGAVGAALGSFLGEIGKQAQTNVEAREYAPPPAPPPPSEHTRPPATPELFSTRLFRRRIAMYSLVGMAAAFGTLFPSPILSVMLLVELVAATDVSLSLSPNLLWGARTLEPPSQCLFSSILSGQHK